jgi:hypothetical protein
MATPAAVKEMAKEMKAIARRCAHLEQAAMEGARKRKRPGQGHMSAYDLQRATLKKNLSKLARSCMDAKPDNGADFAVYYDNTVGTPPPPHPSGAPPPPPRSPPHHPPTNTKNPTKGVRIFVISTVQCLYVGVSNNATFEIEMLELVKGKAHKEGWFDKKEFAALDLDEHTLEEHLHAVFVSSAKSRRAQDKVTANGGAEAAKVNYKRCSPYVRVCVCMYC